MLLLYPYRSRLQEVDIPDLHSTMLLLYPVTVTGYTALSVFIYIPLCFYFIDLSEPHSLHHCDIYIPLCFYFIFPSLVEICFLVFIYIPLCFYFIIFAFRKYDDWLVIYIPLCFYFIIGGHAFVWVTSFIYIPLCFYFIHMSIGHRTGYCEFTFHYASTLSALSALKNILINHLHSTMLLLYPNLDHDGNAWV